LKSYSISVYSKYCPQLLFMNKYKFSVV
jgi:hypothetical protein